MSASNDYRVTVGKAARSLLKSASRYFNTLRGVELEVFEVNQSDSTNEVLHFAKAWAHRIEEEINAMGESYEEYENIKVTVRATLMKSTSKGADRICFTVKWAVDVKDIFEEVYQHSFNNEEELEAEWEADVKADWEKKCAESVTQ